MHFLFFLCLIFSPIFAQENLFKKYNSFYIYNSKLYKQSQNKLLIHTPEGVRMRSLYPFSNKVHERLTAVYEDFNSSIVLLSTFNEIYISQDAGKTFTLLKDHNSFNSKAYITALAIKDKSNLIIGSSMNGVYYSRDGGESFKDLNEKLSSIYLGSSSYDIISAVEFSKEDLNTFLISYGVYGDILLVNLDSGVLEKIKFPREKQIVRIIDLSIKNNREFLVRTYDNSVWHYKNKVWSHLSTYNLKEEREDKASLERLERASNKAGLYLTANTASNKEALKRHFNFIKENDMNSVIIDLKNDNGFLTYKSSNSFAKEMKAIKPLLDLDYIISLAREMDIYLIARLVVFKDKFLFSYDSNKYAIWDFKKNMPWGYLIAEKNGSSIKYVQREHWVDLYSQDVWDYNISIAKEIQDLGFDEIQFDYIRIPTDGPVSQMQFRYKIDDMKPIDALESFLIKTRENIKIPISIDIYGYNGWYPTNYIGQNITMLANYADAISPMYYPSHYSSSFLQNKSYYKERAYEIYNQGVNRAAVFVNNRVLIRPYVQAFLLGEERFVEKPTYTTYLKSQLEGIKNSNSSGYILWNASNNYYMVDGSLKKYLED